MCYEWRARLCWTKYRRRTKCRSSPSKRSNGNWPFNVSWVSGQCHHPQLLPPPSVAPTTRPWRSHVGHVAVKGSHSSIPANFADYRPNFQCDSVGTESLVEPSGAPWRTNHRPPFSHPTQSMNRESIPELLFLPDILPRIHSHNTPRGFLNSLPPLTFLNLSDIPFNIFQRFPYRHRRRCLLFEFLLFFLYIFMYLFIISWYYLYIYILYFCIFNKLVIYW